MPGMSGPEVAQSVTAMRPGTHVLYISGYTDSVDRAPRGARAGHRVPAEAVQHRRPDAQGARAARQDRRGRLAPDPLREPGSIPGVLPPLLRENAQLSPLLLRAGGVAARRPDHADRAAADGRARAARDGRPDGRADDGRARPEPHLLAPRRQLGRPPRRPPAGDARHRRLPRPPDRDGSRRVRARPPDLGCSSTSSRSAPACSSVFFYVAYGGFFQTIVEREDYVAANSLIARQPRLLVPRRHEHRRRARAAAARAVRARDRRGVVFSGRRSSSAGSTRPTRRQARRARAASSPAHAGSAATRSSAPSCWASRRSTSSTSSTSRCSCSMRRGSSTSSRRRSASCSASPPWGPCSARSITGRVSRRFGVGPAFLIGCFLFPAPLILVPAAGGPHWLVLALPVHGRVLLRHRPDAARHPRRRDHAPGSSRARCARASPARSWS